MSSLHDSMVALFDAERRVRSLHESLVSQNRTELLAELRKGIAAAIELDEESEAALRLTRIAGILGELEGLDAVELLIDILGSDSAEARVTAGEALEGLAYDRFKEVALGIERALDRLPSDSPALPELAFLLAEVGEPGCVKLLGRFLKHAEAEVVASAIEALAELSDPAAIPMLAALERDGRQVQLDDEEGEGERVSIGDLAAEARALLEELSEGAEEALHAMQGAIAKGGAPGAKGKPRTKGDH